MIIGTNSAVKVISQATAKELNNRGLTQKNLFITDVASTVTAMAIVGTIEVAAKGVGFVGRKVKQKLSNGKAATPKNQQQQVMTDVVDDDELD